MLYSSRSKKLTAQDYSVVTPEIILMTGSLSQQIMIVIKFNSILPETEFIMNYCIEILKTNTLK